jgi:hypothetical protein
MEVQVGQELELEVERLEAKRYDDYDMIREINISRGYP